MALTFIRILCLTCACLLAVLPARAQINAAGNLAPAPPPPVAREVSVQAGGSVQVPLGIHGGRGERLEFLIRTQPRSGRLSGIVATGENAAAVLYTAAKNAAGVDQFTYAVRNRDGVSAPALVKVTITAPVPLAAKLVLPQQLDLPAIVLGRTSSAELVVRNAGDGVAEGTLAVAEPFRCDAAGRFRIAPGGSTTLKVTCVPQRIGSLSGELVFRSAVVQAVALSIVCEPPLALPRTTLDLVQEPGGMRRVGRFTIENRGDDPQRISVSGPAKLVIARQLTAPAQEHTEFTVEAAPAETEAFTEKLTLTSSEWRAELAVKAPALIAQAPAPTPEPPRPPVIAAEKRIAAPVIPAAREEPAEEPAAPRRPPRLTAAEAANALGTFVREVKPTSAAFEWPASLAEGEPVSVLERRLGLDSKRELQISWPPLGQVKFSRSGDTWRAELGELKPGQLYTVRIVSGAGAEPVFTEQFRTPVKPPFISVGWDTIALWALAAVLSWLLWRQWKTRTRGGW